MSRSGSVCEYGEPLGDVDWGKLPTHPPALSGNLLAESCSSKSGGSGRRKFFFLLQNMYFMLVEFFCMP